MAYNEHLGERIRKVLKEKRVRYEERMMMGGLCFMVNDKMCIGVVKDMLMARIDPVIYERALKRTGCHEMDFTGRPMKGYVFVDPIGMDMDKDLEYWIHLCLEFNPQAKASKKK
jgi:TfoX/Sxy family transcriptional regulator of competence genes